MYDDNFVPVKRSKLKLQYIFIHYEICHRCCWLQTIFFFQEQMTDFLSDQTIDLTKNQNISFALYIFSM